MTKKVTILMVFLIVTMFMLTGCFFIDTSSGYVKRAEKYIAEKYDDLEVEHVMVQGGKANGYASSGYYITHWKTVSEPIVEFQVREAYEDDDHNDARPKGTIGDDYNITLLEIELGGLIAKKLDEHNITDYYIYNQIGGYDRLLLKNEFMTLDEFVSISKNVYTTEVKFPFSYRWKSVTIIYLEQNQIFSIEPEKMYNILKEIHSINEIGVGPKINLEFVEDSDFITDEVTGNMIVDLNTWSIAQVKFTSPSKNAPFDKNAPYDPLGKDEFIQQYEVILDELGGVVE